MGNRIRQKGVKCSVEGCDNWCRAKGLCPKHGMARRRYGNVFGGKIDRSGLCKGCGNKFRLIKSDQEYCNSKCYRSSPAGRRASYEATKAYRLRKRGGVYT